MAVGTITNLFELYLLVGINSLHQAGFKPGSLSGDLLEFDHEALNHLATTAGLYNWFIKAESLNTDI